LLFSPEFGQYEGCRITEPECYFHTGFIKKNAYGVIRFSTTEFEYKSATLGVEKCTKAITILDKKGKDMADFHYSGDRFRELKDFSGKLYDANGIL